jgi:hypothetical protein
VQAEGDDDDPARIAISRWYCRNMLPKAEAASPSIRKTVESPSTKKSAVRATRRSAPGRRSTSSSEAPAM